MVCPECGSMNVKYDYRKPTFQSGQSATYSRGAGRKLCSDCGCDLSAVQQPQQTVKQEEVEQQPSVKFKVTIESPDQNEIDDIIEKAKSDLQNNLANIDHIKITEIIPSDLKPTIGAGYKVEVSGIIYLTSADELSIEQLQSAGEKYFGDTFKPHP